jgi:outer membrane protein TolC
VLLGASSWAVAAPPQAPEKIAAPAEAAQTPVLDLRTCRAAALQQQPAIAAAENSVAAAQARSRGLERLRGLSLIVRELRARRDQAALGVGAAEAQLEQARWDALYNVTRTYLAGVYAREQLRVADDAERELKLLHETAAAIPDKKDEADQLAIVLKVVQGRRETAREGYRRALAALREAMGVGPEVCFDLADSELPEVTPEVCREEIVALALSRRGEMVQAVIGAEVTAKEIQAQSARICGLNVQTFASANDIHALPVPHASRGAEYSPGAVGPEMPPFLVGHRSARMEQARALSERANSVVAKTQNAITLEAEDAYHRYMEALRKLPKAREAAAEAKKRADKLSEDSRNPDLKPRFPEALAAGTLAGQLRLEANETHLQLLFSLAALERITAGGFNPGFGGSPDKRP